MKSYIINLNPFLKHKCFWLLAFGFWLAACNNVFAQSERKFIREGNKSYDKNKYSDAEVEYKKSLNKNQKSYEGNFNLGDAYYKQGKYDEAAKQFETLKSQKKDSKTTAANLHNLGNTLLKNQKYKESIEAYKQALKLNPKDEDTRYNLAYAQARLKQQEQQQQQQQQQKDQEKKKGDKKDQQKQNQEQQKQQEKQAQEKQQQQKKEISKEDAERILKALNNDEKDKHKKKAKVAAARISIDKDW